MIGAIPDSISSAVESSPEPIQDPKSVRFLVNFLFLLGVGLLWASSSLGWWHAWRVAAFKSATASNTLPPPAALFFVRKLLDVASFLTTIAGAAGFLLWLFPRSKSFLPLWRWVYLPAAVAIQFGFAAVLTMPALLHSAVKPWGDGSIWAAAGLLHLVVNGGAGLHFVWPG